MDRPMSDLMMLLRAIRELETADFIWAEICPDESGEVIAGEAGHRATLFSFDNLEEMFRNGTDWVLMKLRGD